MDFLERDDQLRKGISGYAVIYFWQLNIDRQADQSDHWVLVENCYDLGRDDDGAGGGDDDQKLHFHVA